MGCRFIDMSKSFNTEKRFTDTENYLRKIMIIIFQNFKNTSRLKI